MIKNRKGFFLFVFYLFLNGCAGTSITSAIGNAVFSEKGFHKTIDDSLIYTRIKTNALSLGFETLSNIGIHVFNGRVLLVGSVRNFKERLKLVKIAWKEQKVVEVINEISIDKNYSLYEVSKDLYLQSKIASSLLLEEKIISNNYSIQVYKKNIYVIGLSRSLNEKNEIEDFLLSFKESGKIFNFIKIKK